MDSDAYCKVYYSTNHVTTELRNLWQDTQFVRARNKNHEAKFGKRGDHRRQIQYPSSRDLPPSPKLPVPHQTFNNNNVNRRCNTVYLSSQAPELIGHNQIPQLTVQKTLHISPDHHHTVVSLSHRNSDWASRNGTLWMRWPTYDCYCTDIRQQGAWKQSHPVIRSRNKVQITAESENKFGKEKVKAGKVIKEDT